MGHLFFTSLKIPLVIFGGYPSTNHKASSHPVDPAVGQMELSTFPVRPRGHSFTTTNSGHMYLVAKTSQVPSLNSWPKKRPNYINDASLHMNIINNGLVMIGKIRENLQELMVFPMKYGGFPWFSGQKHAP
jgi:hypothetical protein